MQLVDNDVTYEIDPLYFNVTCAEWIENLLNNKRFISDFQVKRSADGNSITLVSSNSPSPAIDKGFVLNGVSAGGEPCGLAECCAPQCLTACGGCCVLQACRVYFAQLASSSNHKHPHGMDACHL